MEMHALFSSGSLQDIETSTYVSISARISSAIFPTKIISQSQMYNYRNQDVIPHNRL